MNHLDRLYDEYELHKRRYLLKDELEVMVSELPVSRPGKESYLLDHVGDTLIALGNSLKRHGSDGISTRLNHVRGDA